MLIGRQLLWGLAAGGEEGVRVLEMLLAEVDPAGALCGACNAAEVTRALVG